MTDVSLRVPNSPEYLRVIRQIAMVVGTKADLPLDSLDEAQLASDEAANILMKFATPGASLSFEWEARPGRVLVQARAQCALPKLPDLPGTLEYAWVIITAITRNLKIFLENGEVHVQFTVESAA